MSKVLRMIDFDELITWRHQEFLIEKGMKESEDENITDTVWCPKNEKYVNSDGDFTSDDIPF